MNEVKMQDEKKMNVNNHNNNQNNERVNYYHPFWSLFNDCFSDEDTAEVMKTDIRDHGDCYKMEIEVPGVDKKDVKISLDKGYLSISAKSVSSEDSTHGKTIHKERFYGSYRRSYYVGDGVTKEDITASMDNGILTVVVNKPKEKAEEEKYIQIQ